MGSGVFLSMVKKIYNFFCAQNLVTRSSRFRLNSSWQIFAQSSDLSGSVNHLFLMKKLVHVKSTARVKCPRQTESLSLNLVPFNLHKVAVRINRHELFHSSKNRSRSAAVKLLFVLNYG